MPPKIDHNPRKIASSRLARRIPYERLIERQRERITEIDERIGRLMSQRANEEEVLAEMIAMAPRAALENTREGFPTSKLTDSEIAAGWSLCTDPTCKATMNGRTMLGPHAHHTETP